MEKGRDENRVDMIYQLMITAVLKALQEHLFKKTVFWSCKANVFCFISYNYNRYPL